MFNLEMKESVLAQFKENIAMNREANCGDIDLGKYMDEGNVDLVRDCVTKVKDNVVAAIPVGIDIPRVSLYCRATGDADAISLVMVTITNVLSSDKKFKFSLSLSNRNATEVAFDFFEGVYERLIVDTMIEENLQDVNEILKNATEEAGLNYTVKIVPPMGNEGKKISFMSDEEIIFVADPDRALSLDDVLVLQEPHDLITDEMIEGAFKVEVENLAEAQTPEQLVAKHGGLLVQYICDVSKLVKPMTLIKKICNKNIMNARGNKDCIMYYHKDGVFSLIAKREGNLEVILSPFDTDTLRKVDVDVLAGVEA